MNRARLRFHPEVQEFMSHSAPRGSLAILRPSDYMTIDAFSEIGDKFCKAIAVSFDGDIIFGRLVR